MENDEPVKVNLRQYKGHFRKFPWALLVRIMVIIASLAVIFFLMKTVTDLQEKKQGIKKDLELEIELPD